MTASPTEFLKHKLGVGLAEAERLLRRGLPDAPNGYTPTQTECPAIRPSIRQANTLSQDEQTWLKQRSANTIQPMKELLARLNITGLDTNDYIKKYENNVSSLPKIGIACSGGGWRALLNGAGALAAFDSRTPDATSKGHLGGVLQSATYLSGLSGGSWLVGSIYMNNFSTIPSLLYANPDQTASGGLWQFSRSLLQGMIDG